MKNLEFIIVNKNMVIFYLFCYLSGFFTRLQVLFNA